MKKARVFVYFLWMFYPFLITQAGDKTKNLKLGVEFGTGIYFGDLIMPERVRENKSTYPYSYMDDYGVIDGDELIVGPYVGVKSEYFLLRNRLGITAGLRLSSFSTSLHSDGDYFLWLLKQEHVYTDYVKIREIKQNSFYIGIPLEVRFFPNKRELPFQHYFKFGASFNYRIQTNNNILFMREEMSRYAGEIEAEIDNPNDFIINLYPAIGFKIGRQKATWFNVEFQLPGAIVSRNAFPLIKTNAGLGFQLSVQIPLGKTVPIGSE
ncbi:MAG: hypothetical protein LBM08_08630 [Dysgonamonadaceae bacterium]|nr:hypothetical protein [Dysgonamonadaceae bacterium]